MEALLEGGNPANKTGAIAAFLEKTWHLVDDKSTDDIISWTQNGTTFTVWKTKEFAKQLLPTVFKHSNYSSFCKNLNIYRFKKLSSRQHEFQHEHFVQHDKSRLARIRRSSSCVDEQLKNQLVGANLVLKAQVDQLYTLYQLALQHLHSYGHDVSAMQRQVELLQQDSKKALDLCAKTGPTTNPQALLEQTAHVLSQPGHLADQRASDSGGAENQQAGHGRGRRGSFDSDDEELPNSNMHGRSAGQARSAMPSDHDDDVPAARSNDTESLEQPPKRRKRRGGASPADRVDSIQSEWTGARASSGYLSDHRGKAYPTNGVNHTRHTGASHLQPSLPPRGMVAISEAAYGHPEDDSRNPSPSPYSPGMADPGMVYHGNGRVHSHYGVPDSEPNTPRDTDALGYDAGARRPHLDGRMKQMTAADLPSPFAPGGASTAALLDAVGLVEMQRQYLANHAGPSRAARLPQHSSYMQDAAAHERVSAAETDAGHHMAPQEPYANGPGAAPRFARARRSNNGHQAEDPAYEDEADAYGRHAAPPQYARQNGQAPYPERGNNRAFRDWEPEPVSAAYGRSQRYAQEERQDEYDY
ncbi:hypothetical protein WJX72_000403 [[Myrmecia] bisecta]|uniref:HSF-type DNA-binding domain-containing protein n=1 Tax=[Myrmecia] bisecta TaxID=41462 RepID=A0AAW1QDY6_9CHLO